jgi:hypothetical protein
MTAPRRHRRIATATALKRREAQAQRVAHAVSPDAEIERLKAHVDALLHELRARDFTIQAMRRAPLDHECEGED